MITAEQIAAGIDSLPALPASVGRLSALLRDPHTGAEDFERVIRPDAALTANLLRIANSAAFGQAYQVSEVKRAIALLGTDRVFEVAVAMAMGAIIPTHVPGYDMGASGYWEHCAAVATLGEALVRRLGRRELRGAFTAGLLHDVGILVVATYLAESAALLRDAREKTGITYYEAERQVLGTDHADVGAAIILRWGLPSHLSDAARYHHRPDDAEGLESSPMVDIVHVADCMAYAFGFGADVGGLDRRISPGALRRLGATGDLLEAVAADTLDTIYEVVDIFEGGGGGARGEGAA